MVGVGFFSPKMQLRRCCMKTFFKGSLLQDSYQNEDDWRSYPIEVHQYTKCIALNVDIPITTKVKGFHTLPSTPAQQLVYRCILLKKWDVQMATQKIILKSAVCSFIDAITAWQVTGHAISMSKASQFYSLYFFTSLFSLETL